MNRSNGCSGGFSVALSVLVLLGAVATVPGQTVWYVDDDAIGDPGPGDVGISDPAEDGSAAHPFDAIQEAIDASTNGDEVLLAEGWYCGVGNRDLTISGKALTVRSDVGPERCVIDCEKRGVGFSMPEGIDDDREQILEGLTVTRGFGREGGAVNSRVSITLRDCRFTECETMRSGGGLCLWADRVNIINCLICDNSSSIKGGGLYSESLDLTLINCTFIDNVAEYQGGGIYAPSSSDSIRVTNCVLWNNNKEQIYRPLPNTQITYSNIQGGWPGVGNISVDPRFAFSSDAHLMPDSPCIDAGTNGAGGDLPAFDAEGNVRQLDGDGDGVAVADMGIYETTLAPMIAVDRPEVEITGNLAAGTAVETSLSIRNCGGGNLQWRIEGQPSWLTIIPSHGDSHGEVDEISLAASGDGLGHGVYTAVLAIYDDEAANSPRFVHVTFNLANSFHVPSQYATIQAAIDACQVPGDEVVVADGTYTGAGNRNLDFGGRALTLRSVGGPSRCVIDCQDEGRAFHFHSGEHNRSIVEGVCVTNGVATEEGDDAGGALFCESASPLISNCVFRGNSAVYGGAVGISGPSQPVFVNCVLTDNIASEGGALYTSAAGQSSLMDCELSGNSATKGGGMYAARGTGNRLMRCEFLNNVATDEGGGLYGDELSRGPAYGCTFRENYAYRGGGVYWLVGFPEVVDCTISRNIAGQSGGGIELYACGHYDYPKVTFTNCRIVGNSVENGFGGGVYCDNSTIASLISCLIAGNSANRGGGLYSHWYGDSKCFNCVFTDNRAGSGGAVCTRKSAATLVNCTVRDNPTETGSNVCCLNNESLLTMVNTLVWGESPGEVDIGTGHAIISYCNIRGGYPGTGNVDVDPVFGMSNDSRLMHNSPCIDAGTNGTVDGVPSFDMAGNSRTLDGDGDGSVVTDIGAFEFARGTRQIAVSDWELDYWGMAKEDRSSSQVLEFRNCSEGTMRWEIAEQEEWIEVTPSWGESGEELVSVTVRVDFGGLSHGKHSAVLSLVDVDDSTSLREVTVVAHAGQVSLVPAEFATIQAALNAAIDGDRVVVADGTYSGAGNKNIDFRGKAVELASAGGPSACVIDCEHDGRAFTFRTGETARTIVDGFTMANGSALALDDTYGGAVLCGRAGPRIANCVLRDCVAERGGGVYLDRNSIPAGHDKMRLSACVLSGNSASLGGAIGCYASSFEASNCVLSDNAASSDGGGVYEGYDSICSLISSIIEGNTAIEDGGGICDSTGESLDIVGCLLSANSANYGGAISLYSGAAAVSDCTISGNVADVESGWIDSRHGGVLEMSNSVVAGNQPAGMVDEKIEVQVIRSNIEGGTGQAWFGAGNIDVDPLFVDADGPDDDPDTWEDNDYRLQAGSPCIDAGSNGVVPLDFGDVDGDGDLLERMPWDLDGLTRFFDDPATVDTGVADPPRYVAVVDMGAYEFGGVRVGDFDGDYDVDLADYAGLQICLAGDLAGSAECVGAFDFDGDGVVSVEDLGPFELVLAGP